MTKLLLIGIFMFLPALASQIDLAQPKYDEFVHDHANLLSADAEREIHEVAQRADVQFGTPIVVITIERISDFSSIDSIEEFATTLFNQWGIGYKSVNGNEHNTGILLVVSKGDRKARIELGASWGHDQDSQAQYIMDKLIIPHFKKDDYEAGILAGVEGFDAIVQDKPLPSAPISAGAIFAVIAFIGLLIFTIVSLIRRGSSGWAWLFWGMVFVFLGMMLRRSLQRNSSGWSGGGGFGGGISGGGGASGSW